MLFRCRESPEMGLLSIFRGLRMGATEMGLLSIFRGLRVGLATEIGLLSIFRGLRVGLLTTRLPLIFIGLPRLGLPVEVLV